MYDAVGIYEALKGIIDMKPVAQKVDISFEQLIREVQQNRGEAQAEALRQLTAKWQHRKVRMSEQERQDFETASGGLKPEEFAGWLLGQSHDKVAQWFTEQGILAEILDAKRQGSAAPIIISNHDDELLGTETGYGEGRTRPEDYPRGVQNLCQRQS